MKFTFRLSIVMLIICSSLISYGANLKLISAPPATTYYVSNSGNDANTGLSLPEAFLTIQKASDVVQAGDLVLVEDGTYAGFDHRSSSGTSSQPIEFRALGDNVLINQSGPIRNDGINVEGVDYIIIDGFIVNDMTGNGNGIRVVLSDNCIVKNCRCDNNAARGIFTAFTDDILIEYNICTNTILEHGIYVSNSSDRPIIRYNECYGNNFIGIHMNGDLSQGGDGIISDPEIYGNVLHDNNKSAGINLDGVENPIIYNNLIYNNHDAQGIALFQGDGAIVTSGAKIYNNTIVVPSDGRWGILLKDGSNVNTEIYNNIIINQHAWRGAIAAENLTGLNSDYNVLSDKMSAVGDGSAIPLADWQILGNDANSVISDLPVALFVDYTNGDLHLLDDAQAIDIGTSLVSGIVTEDIEGNPRPNGIYDIGGYESPITLAVDLIQPLNARVKDGVVLLSWSTGTEINSDYFTVERSTTLSDWQMIEHHLSSKNKGHTYHVVDKNPPEGLVYYKLMEYDLDGHRTLLGIVSVNYEGGLQLKVFPNPASDVLNVQFQPALNNGKVNFQLLNAEGIKVMEGIISNNKIDVSVLKMGVYMLSVFTGITELHRQIVIE